MQEPCKISLVWNNIARYQIFARNLSNIFYLQECCKLSIVSKNLSRHLFCKIFSGSLTSAGNSQAVYFLQESCKMTLICKNNARYLLFARIWQDISNLHKCRKISLFCKILDFFYLLSRILIYIFWLQESWQKSIVCNRQHLSKNLT